MRGLVRGTAGAPRWRSLVKIDYPIRHHGASSFVRRIEAEVFILTK
jgi:hypothetical protein